MVTVAVTGVSGVVGQELLRVLDADSSVSRVLGVDARPSRFRPSKLVHHALDPVSADLKAAFEGADWVVHLANVPGHPRDDGSIAAGNVTAVRRMLDAASAVGAEGVVHVSTSLVYGAWPDNAVPLTEDAPLRPNPGFHPAVVAAEAERLVQDWADDHPSATTVVLRPTVVVSPGGGTWVTQALGDAPRLPMREGMAPRQFLHVEDLASAAAWAVSHRLGGVFNVAPDGAVSGEVVLQLAGGPPRLPLPEGLARALREWAWRLHLSDNPPALAPFEEHAWVVANDRLRLTGWAPAHTNEEAFVVTRPGSAWREMSPRRKQEVALAATGVVGIAAIVGGVALVRRLRRRPRP